ADDLLELAELRRDVLGVVDRELAPVLARHLVERRLVHRLALLEEDLALVVDELAVRRLTDQLLLQAAEERVTEDLHLLVALALEPLLLRGLDRDRALVLLRPLAGEDARVDDDAADARRNPQRAVADVARLLAEDRPEELLLGGELGLALRGDLA